MTDTTALLGYCSPLAVEGGQTVKLSISSNGPERCTVEVLRIICGDLNPGGPGQQFEPQPWFKPTETAVRHQSVDAGSYAVVAPSPRLDSTQGVFLSMTIFPTLLAGKTQALLSWGDLDLRVHNGALAFGVGGALAVCSEPLVERRWYRVTAAVDRAAGEIGVGAEMLHPVPGLAHRTGARAPLGDWRVPGPEVPLFLAASPDSRDSDPPTTSCHFNGKIESLRLALDDPSNVVAAWDFSLEMQGSRIVDTGPAGCHGRLVNGPMRAATGSNWDGSVESWHEASEQYGAIHFHDDDMTDCGWDTDVEIKTPTNARSGYYLARMSAPGIVSDVPFFIAASPGRPKARVLLIAPTATYLAYANTHVKFDSLNTENLFESVLPMSTDELYLNEHRELGLSLYDTHADGSGVVYASERRPMLNTRPGLYTFNYLDDTHILKWLEDRGTPYDVATDGELHRDGENLLQGYAVVMTACHPEYYSTAMWDALAAYQNGGGRHMYLGGNGFYWRIAFSDEHPGVIENRRGVSGVRTWEGQPGEHHLSFSGEPGGLWRTHGRAPQLLVGTGFSSTLFVKSVAFRRTEASMDPAVAFVFRGVNSERFGDFGYRGGGCVGMELDRWDAGLGSPPNSLVIATSEPIGPGGLLSGEEFTTTTRALDGGQNAKVRADMVFFTTEGGGAVWSTGSIAWATSLLWNSGDNDVSRITGNVLDRFLDPVPFD